MCGIVGFSKDPEADYVHPDTIKTLLLALSEDRGTDGTGVWCSGSEILKDGGKASKFLTNFREPVDPTAELILGHVRKMSYRTGKAVQEEAQPFLVEAKNCSLVGVHNGVIPNYAKLKQMFCEVPFVTSPTDSHALFMALAQCGTYDPLLYYDGSAAIIFTDKDDPEQHLCAYRDETRPMFYGKTDVGIFLSSTAESLRMIECTDIREVIANKIYLIREGKVVNTRDLPARTGKLENSSHNCRVTPAHVAQYTPNLQTYDDYKPTDIGKLYVWKAEEMNLLIDKWLLCDYPVGATPFKDSLLRTESWYHTESMSTVPSNPEFPASKESHRFSIITQDGIRLKEEVANFYFACYKYDTRFQMGQELIIMRSLMSKTNPSVVVCPVYSVGTVLKIHTDGIFPKYDIHAQLAGMGKTKMFYEVQGRFMMPADVYNAIVLQYERKKQRTNDEYIPCG